MKGDDEDDEKEGTNPRYDDSAEKGLPSNT